LIRKSYSNFCKILKPKTIFFRVWDSLPQIVRVHWTTIGRRWSLLDHRRKLADHLLSSSGHCHTSNGSPSELVEPSSEFVELLSEVAGRYLSSLIFFRTSQTLNNIIMEHLKKFVTKNILCQNKHSTNFTTHNTNVIIFERCFFHRTRFLNASLSRWCSKRYRPIRRLILGH